MFLQKIIGCRPRVSISRPGYCYTAAKAVALAIAAAMLCLPALGAIRKTPTPPGTPGNFHVVSSTDTSVTFAWTASTAPSNSNLVYVIVNQTTGLSLNVGDVTSYTWTEVQAGGTYSFYIYAVELPNNASAHSPLLTVTVPGTPIPTAVQPAPPVITQISATSDTITVNWSEATPVNEIGSFDLLVNGMTDGGGVSNSTTATTAANLWPGTTFTVRVQVYSLNGVTGALSATSAPVTVTTEPSTTVTSPPAPTAPTGLTGWGDGGGEAIISWNPSTSPNTPQSQIQYDIYIDGVLDIYDSSVTSQGTAGQTQNIYIFPRGATTPAQVFVVAVDQFGNESLPSNVLTINSF
jgi:hypothetical protein